jgi:hypothetical protein
MQERKDFERYQKEKLEARTISSADEYMEIWSREDDSERRWILNEFIVPLEVCREAIRREPETKWQLLGNQLVPLELLYDLCDDPEEWVRARILGKRKCPVDIIRKYSRDPSDRIRCSVAGKPKAPKDVLIYLKKDRDPDVRKKARQSLLSLSR